MRHTMVLMALAATALQAQPGGWRGAFDGDGPADRARLEQLGLTQAQIQTVDTIWTRKMQEITPLQADLRVKQAQIARALVPATPNLDEVKRLMREVTDLEYQIRVKMLEAEMEVRRSVGEDVWVRMVQDRRGRPRLRPGTGPLMGPSGNGPGRGPDGSGPRRF